MVAGLGLVVGKFLPPHQGHHHVIEQALAASQQVLVLVCGLPSDFRPAAERAAWLRAAHPRAEVRSVTDDLTDDPALAADHALSAAWAHRVRLLTGEAGLPTPDRVFSSEEYGPRFARYLGAEHTSVDPDRARHPISGTMLRTDPERHWTWLHSVVRTELTRRVCVLGAESTGTTTLATDLAGHYACQWVPEYGREYCERLLAERGEIEWADTDFEHIAATQVERELTAAARTTRPLLICDTDALATTIWQERYLGRATEGVRRLAARDYDLHLLTGDDIPFVQDGTRDGEHLREWMTERFRTELSATGRNWVELRGSRSERLAAAVALVDALPGPLTPPAARDNR
jgi:NadR type nicotinamide-nucleotide adenylyltransferase